MNNRPQRSVGYGLPRKGFAWRLLVAALALLPLALNAEEEPLPGQAESVEPQPAEALRDPFWPIGYTPAKTATAQPDKKATVEEKPSNLQIKMEDLTPEKLSRLSAQIVVGGILKQGARQFVLVNNRMVTLGDVIEVSFEGSSYRFIVRSLTEQNVTLEPETKDAPNP